MKRKKLLFKSLILSVALLIFASLVLVGCGGDETESSSSAPTGNSSVVDSVGDSTTDGSTDASTDASTGDTDNSTTDSSKVEDTTPCEHKGGTATCTAKAKCTECGQEYGSLLEHDYAEATCVSPKVCKVCNAFSGDALGHEEIREVIEPTCVNGGITNVTCARCDYIGTEDSTNALGHQEQYDIVAPTCYEGGITNVTCARCDYTATKDETAALGHDYRDQVVPPTCYEGGITNVSCARCDYTDTKDETAALGHDYQEQVVAPTCTVNGITNITCSRCDYASAKDEVTALGHSFTVYQSSVDPTCSNDGYDIIKCERCTETTNEANNNIATGIHTLSFYKNVKPTCVEVGYKLYKCANCDFTWKNPDQNTPNEPLTEDIVATIDHNYDYATVDGLVACVMCGSGYRDVTVESAQGDDAFCMGCGKEPCECGAIGGWSGFTPAKDPEQLTAETKFTKSEVTLSSGNVALQIGGGLIVLTGEADTTYTVVIYATVDGAAVDTVEVSGDYVLLFLDKYESVAKVEITASTDASVSFYVAE